MVYLLKQRINYHHPYSFTPDEMAVLFIEIQNCLESGQLTNGNYVFTLEEIIKDMYQVDYCIATSNATTGLMLCLHYTDMINIQMPAFNWWSDLYITDFLDLRVNFIDIDKDTWLPIDNYEEGIYLNTFGNIGKATFPLAIYDSTHCLGAKITDIGLAHVFSLAPTKLVTSCEGGLIITNDKDLYEWAKERRDKMCRMSEVHAIIGLQYLSHLPEFLKWKEEVYFYYRANIPGQFQKIPDNSSYNTIGFLNTENLTMPDTFEYRQYYEPLKKGLINTDYVYNNIICLPSFYGVDYRKIAKDIREANE
jgi:dTDP-4-amino-4,6-dideoxygalactose transaminase